MVHSIHSSADEIWMRIHRYPDADCPICGKPDWCLVTWEHRDGLPVAVICARSNESVHGGYEFVKHIPNSGTLYSLKGSVAVAACRAGRGERTRQRCIFLRSNGCRGAPDLELLCEECRDRLMTWQMGRLVEQLRVCADTLHQFRIGWHSGTPTGFSIPMRNEQDTVVAAQIRTMEGNKLSVYGSKPSHGLFIPHGLNFNEILFVTEGFSDAAAVLDTGLAAVGRYNKSQDSLVLQRFIRQHAIQQVCMIADNDADGDGLTAAQRVASDIMLLCRSAVISPPAPCKDVREFLTEGDGGRDQLLELARLAAWYTPTL